MTQHRRWLPGPERTRTECSRSEPQPGAAGQNESAFSPAAFYPGTMKDWGTLAPGSAGAAGTGTGLTCPCLGVRFCDVRWATHPPRASVSPPVKWACYSAHPAGCEDRRGGESGPRSQLPLGGGRAFAGRRSASPRSRHFYGLWSVGPKLGRKSCFSVASRLLTPLDHIS